MSDLDPSQSTLSPNFAPYVYDMLSRGQGLANLPYQEYTGQRFAGPSALQSQAFQGFQNLGTPGQFDTASQLATQAGQAAGNLSYTPSGMPSFGQVTSGYQAPAAYQTGSFTPGFNFSPTGGASFTNQFTAPGAYEAAKFNTGLGALGSVQDYMNQYTSGVTDISAREARRQADIGRQSEQARLSQAGAYGGSRQAIMEAERQRNLNQQIEDISTKGLQSAYDNALKQRYQEAGLGLQAQEAGERSRQFGAQQGMTAADLAARYGLSAQQAQEASRQFSEGQRLNVAQLQSQFGLEAQRAGEQSRQFGSTQGLTSAQQAAQFGLTAQQANQQAALEAARQAESSRQFGAKYGLEGLGQQLQAAQMLGSLGTQQQQAGLAGLQAQLSAGEKQQQLAQSPLDFAYQQFQESMKYPYQQTSYMQSLLQGLPLQARPYDSGQSGLASALSGGLSGLALYNLFNKP
jgi:hypothetical protein